MRRAGTRIFGSTSKEPGKRQTQRMKASTSFRKLRRRIVDYKRETESATSSRPDMRARRVIQQPSLAEVVVRLQAAPLPLDRAPQLDTLWHGNGKKANLALPAGGAGASKSRVARGALAGLAAGRQKRGASAGRWPLLPRGWERSL